MHVASGTGEKRQDYPGGLSNTSMNKKASQRPKHCGLDYSEAGYHN